MLEQFPRANKAIPASTPENLPPSATLEDFHDEPEIYTRLVKLPAELRAAHIRKIEDLSDTDSIAYLESILEKRESAMRESLVSDNSIRSYFEGHAEEIWKSLETNVFTDENNFIDSGTTAKIKSFTIENQGSGETLPTFAVKYLVHPTSTTLTVDSEHSILKEVEQMNKIEKAAASRNDSQTFIKVPHPYFYYRKGKTQCYGMELIDGINLWEASTREYNPDLKKELRAKFKDIDIEALLTEIDLFFDTMHEICVHNDVKPRNIMASREGKFYLIDFGQSILTTHVDDRGSLGIEDRKVEEKNLAKSMIQNFLLSLERD